MSTDNPPNYSETDSDLSDEGGIGTGHGVEPQILIVPAASGTGFQTGYLGADLERAAIEGEIHVKSAERIQWNKVTISLQTVEKADAHEIELNSSELTLFSSPTDRRDIAPTLSTFPFSIPLPPDTPQCIHAQHSALSHTLTARLISAEPDSRTFTERIEIHTRRYTSHNHTLGIAPETKVISDPTRIEVQVPRSTFKAGEPIPLYLTVPTPRRELILDEGLRLRNVRAEFIRTVTVKQDQFNEGPATSNQAGGSTPAGSAASQRSTSVQKEQTFSSSHALDMRSHIGVPGGGEVIALSGASCRLNPSRPLRIRLVLHPPQADASLTNQTANVFLEDGSHQEAVIGCASITQATLLLSVSFTLCIHATFMHMSSHTERVSTVSIPINIIPPTAPLPEVDESLEMAYHKKHDRPPMRTIRHPETDVPHYEEGVAGPSFHAQGAPPPFEEREAPPPFSTSEPEASTSRLPTFLESETEIFMPQQEDQVIDLPPTPEFVFEGEGVLFGFSPADQFDGYSQEQDRPMTPPPTLEQATMDRDVTELATLTESDAVNAVAFALQQQNVGPNAELLPPPPIDDHDPPPSIDSAFTPPSRRHTGSPPHHTEEAPPAFTGPVDVTQHPPPPPPQLSTDEESPSLAHGHAPPPYRVPDTPQQDDHDNVSHPPPYVD